MLVIGLVSVIPKNRWVGAPPVVVTVIGAPPFTVAVKLEAPLNVPKSKPIAVAPDSVSVNGPILPELAR